MTLAIKQRILSLVVAAIALQLLFALLPVPLHSRSERFHACVLLLWLFDFLIFGRREPDPKRALKTLVFAVVTFGLAFFFWDLLKWQAKQSDTRAMPGEVVWRGALVGSLVVLYSVWVRALAWLMEQNKVLREFSASPRGWVLRGVRAAFAVLVFAPYLFTAMNAHRFKLGNGITPRSAHNLEYEDVSFSSQIDGVPLRGWLVPAKAEDAKAGRAIVVCHGLGANRGIFLGVAPFLHRAGFTVLMFDFRGHGESAGHTISFGHDEARDVGGAVAFLQKRGFKHIALYGFSMGGASVLNAAPQLAVDAVVVDSAFADFPSLVAQALPVAPALRDVGLKVVDLYGRVELGVSSGEISPRPRIPQISPRALLVVHGTGDTLIPFRQAQEIHKLGGASSELWLVKGANHCLCRPADVKAYEARVTRFLQRHVG